VAIDLFDQKGKPPRPPVPSGGGAKFSAPGGAMVVMNLTLDDFKDPDIRITANNKISVYDGIAKFFGCSTKEAQKKFTRLCDKSPFWGSIELYPFDKKDGRAGIAIPSATFQELLEICSQLPGKPAQILRREQAQITTRVAAGDGSMIDVVANRAATIEPEVQAVLLVGVEPVEASKEAKSLMSVARKQVSKKKLHIRSLQKKLQEKKVELESSEAELKKANKNLRIKDKKLKSVQLKLEETNAELGTKDATIKETTKQLATKEEVLKNTATLLGSTEHTLVTTTEELKSTKNVVEELFSGKQLDELCILALQDDLEELRAKCDKFARMGSEVFSRGQQVFSAYQAVVATIGAQAQDLSQHSGVAAAPANGVPDQDGASSKSSRYCALVGVTAATNGLTNRVVRDLNDNTLKSIGQNIWKHSNIMHLTQNQKLQICRNITGAVGDRRQTMLNSSINLRNKICALYKWLHGLEHATYANLGQMRKLVRKCNEFFASVACNGEFILVAEADLDRLLGFPTIAHQPPRPFHSILNHFHHVPLLH
jgi:hypothetical protein